MRAEARIPFNAPPPTVADSAPHNLEAEQALLGCLMFDNSAFERLHDGARAHYFFEPFHQRLFAMIEQQIRVGRLAEPITLLDKFKNDQAFQDLGGIRYFADLVDRAPPAANANDYARVIRDTWLRRQMLKIGQDGGDVAALLKEAAALSDGSSKKFVFEALDDITLAPDEWRVHELFPKVGVGFLAGQSGTGKSFVAVDWSMRLAAGLPVLERHTEQAGVAYVAAEGAAGVRKRVKGWQARQDIGDRLPFRLTDQAPDLRLDSDMGSLIRELSSIKADFQHAGADLGLVVIDTLSQVVPGGDQNGQGDMTIATRNARMIAEKLKTFVLIIHHVGKDAARGMAGSFVLYAAADLVILLTGEKQDAVKPCLVDKVKDAQDGWRFAFRLEPLTFENNGSTFSTCVPSYVDAPIKVDKAKPRTRLNAWAELVLKAFGQAWDSESWRVTAPLDEPGVRAGQMAIPKARVKEVALKIGLNDDDLNDEALKKRFSRAIADLSAAGKVRVCDRLIWPV